MTDTVSSQNTTIGVNSFNDIYIGSDGNLVVLTGADALTQICVQVMKGQLGEMIFQPSDGLPNLTDVWLQQNLVKWEAAARQQLIAVNGITGIASFTYDVAFNDATQQYELSYLAVLNSVYSQTLTISAAITGPLQ